MWDLNIQNALNGLGGIKCGMIYTTGNHFTVPVELFREKTPHLVTRIKSIVEKHKQANYTYTINFITKPKK